MKNIRIYIEKKPHYDVHSHSLHHKIKHIGNPSSLKLYLIYDIFGIDEKDEPLLMDHILASPQTDLVHHQQPPAPLYIAWEYLAGQYDQRGEAATQCLALLSSSPLPTIKSGYFLALSEDATPYLSALKKYLINPVDSCAKDLNTLRLADRSSVAPLEKMDAFNQLAKEEIPAFIASHRLTISVEDVLLIQQHFQKEGREPTLAELKIIDTYWSDHCRHTTFLTHLHNLEIQSHFEREVRAAWEHYLSLRQELQRQHTPISLMDLATIIARYFKKKHTLKAVEESEENNACSVHIDVDTATGKEPWLLMFKNETHNHPTEIDPYGGASTCIGGAIRDPLSGRAYVYQAMRITGCANPLEPIENTLEGKLPQQKITSEAAQGFSSYGNQIGLTTSHVTEIYHEGYKAKRMEVGLVVGAVKASYVRRASPKTGDIVLLLGGKTGKDGIGGASGSSKTVEKNNSHSNLSSEVQKGNAPLERTLQRLFCNPSFLAYVKKSNDFGAGGVSVAIGELARGIHVDLDKVPLKYRGLNGLEIAISESQERMAIVCDAKDVDAVIALAQEENVEATAVAKVTDDDCLTMVWKGETIVHLHRRLLDTNGAPRTAKVCYQDGTSPHPFTSVPPFSKALFLEKLQSLDHASQEGLLSLFDQSIGKRTVLSPLGGTYQKTKEDVGIQLLPAPTSSTCSAIAYGYTPAFATWSTFHAGLYAVLDSVTKLVAAGVERSAIYLSFQEYFERLGNQPVAWGKPLGALLGAFAAQYELGVAAIGGKDSMSGSYDHIHVPPTLISFAVGTLHIEKTIPNTLPKNEAFIYLATPRYNEHYIPQWDDITHIHQTIHRLNATQTIHAAKAIHYGGIAICLAEMAWGNQVGLAIEAPHLNTPFPGGILIATATPIHESHFNLIGKTTTDDSFTFNGERISIHEAMHAWEKTLAPVFPHHSDTPPTPHDLHLPCFSPLPHLLKNKNQRIAPHVCLPVFPGTNCEYDVAQSFENEGAIPHILVFKNQNQRQISESIEALQRQIERSQILCFSGGFSYADEPDGAAKYIATIIKHPLIAASIERLLAQDGLVLGICNGFQALVKSGLLSAPHQPIPFHLSHNLVGRHVSTIAQVKIISSLSPWIAAEEVGKVYRIPISHGEGRFTLKEDVASTLHQKGQIVSQYVDLKGEPSMVFPYNPNGSDFAIEGITDSSGKIYGRMGHPERYKLGLFRNIPHIEYHNIFRNGIQYFE